MEIWDSVYISMVCEQTMIYPLSCIINLKAYCYSTPYFSEVRIPIAYRSNTYLQVSSRYVHIPQSYTNHACTQYVQVCKVDYLEHTACTPTSFHRPLNQGWGKQLSALRNILVFCAFLVFFFSICPPPGLLPVLGSLERYRLLHLTQPCLVALGQVQIWVERWL